MNTREATALFSSALFCVGSTNWWEPAQVASLPPMLGSGATPHSTFFCGTRALSCQMPFQLNAFLLFWNATKSASWAILAGELPFLIRSTYQVIAFTPGSSAQVAV